MAVQVTEVEPNPKIDPDGGAQLAVTAGQLSEKVGVIVAAAPLELVHCRVWSNGQLMSGFCMSFTVTVAGQEAVAWSGLVSVAVRITFVTPRVYGPAGDWFSVMGSRSGSNEALLTDAFAVLHRLLSVLTITGLHSASGGTPTVPVMLANVVVSGVGQLEFMGVQGV